jgi:hypothetical protein
LRITELTFLTLICMAYFVQGGIVRGRVTDATTGEDIIGAIINIENTSFATATDLDGKYVLHNIPSGVYNFFCSYLGYKTAIQTFTVQNNQVSELNFTITQLSNVTEEIIIKGQVDKEEDSGARLMEKNAMNVINMVSARTIERSPDITLSAVVQRLSGVTLDRSSDGQTQYAIIRGMDPRYSNTLINGIKIPSPDSKNRFIPLDIIPAELLQRTEVSKSLTPEMEGDAIGGTINAVMKE